MSLSILAILLNLVIGAPQPQLDSASVAGIVVGAGTGEALAGATVELSPAFRSDVYQFGVWRSAPSNPPYSTTTGSDGKFVITNVQPGSYRLAATQATGHVMIEYGQNSPNSRGTAITLGAGQKLTDVRLAMASAGSISGRILDRDGEPVVRAQVQALKPSYRDGQKLLDIVQSVQTNDLGEYRLFWLPSGAYYVSARAEDPQRRYATLMISPPGAGGAFNYASPPLVTRRTLENGQVVEEAFVHVYFPGTTESQTASQIEVHPNEHLGGVDFSIGAGQVRAYHVRGRVVSNGGQPGAEIVTVHPREAARNVILPGNSVEDSGLFDIPGVVPGSYLLFAMGYGITRIEVGDSDLDNVSIVAASGQKFIIAGRVVIEGRNAAEDGADLIRLRVNLTRDPESFLLPPPPPPFPGGQAPGAVSADGTFSLRNIAPDDYRMTISGIPTTLYLKSIRQGATDVSSGRLYLDQQSDGPFEIVLSSRPGTVEGRVVNERKEPAGSVTVVLVPDAAHRQRLDLYKNTTTDAEGRFRVEGLAPGDYKVFAWEDVAQFAWQNAEFMRAYESRGRLIHIDQASTIDAEVTVNTR